MSPPALSLTTRDTVSLSSELREEKEKSHEPSMKNRVMEQELGMLREEVARLNALMPTTTVTPTQHTNVVAVNKKGKGLSELARQLRVMQAKNAKLSAEIGRLERQLRILADTSGVSVTDLRGTLQQACESEAYGELQSQLASLQAQLEEAQCKQRKAADFDREAEGKKMANLELRIGELEEVEGALRQEIGQLYKSQDTQAEEATKLKMVNNRQAKEIDALKKQLDELEVRNNKQLEKVPPVPVPPIRVPPKANDQPVQARTESNQKKPPPDSSTATTGPPDVKSTEYESSSQDFDHVENSQLQLLRKQVAARGKELELKESQYKTRFTMQEERIVDMEQQLSSLYTAFALIDQEHSQEKRSKEELTRALRLADSQVAKSVDYLQRNSSATINTPATGGDLPSKENSPAYLTASHAAGSSPGRAPPKSPVQTGGTPGITDIVFAGTVNKRGRLNRWKKLHASLCRGFATFQLHLSESAPLPGSGKKPTVYSLVVFRSSFEVLKGLSNHPYAFRIKMDQYHKGGTELVLSVNTEEELNQWITGLQEAVNGANAPKNVTTPMGTTPPIITQPRNEVGNAAAYDSDLQTALQQSLRESEQGSGAHAGGSREGDDDELNIALAESLRLSEQGSAAHRLGQEVEESKDEIGHSESSDADLRAALQESLLTEQSHQIVDL